MNDDKVCKYTRVCHILLDFKVSVFGVFEDLKFEISEGSDQNWCFPGSAQLAVSV